MREKKLIRKYDPEIRSEPWIEEITAITTRDFLDPNDKKYLEAYEIILERFFQLDLKEKEMLITTLQAITEKTI